MCTEKWSRKYGRDRNSKYMSNVCIGAQNEISITKNSVQ